MNMQARLLSTLRAEPDNHSARLIYADWLEERGSEQATLIRAQLELAATPLHSPRRRELAAVVDDLEDSLLPQWIDGLTAAGASRIVVAGGFVHEAVFPARLFLQHAEQIFTQAPMLLSVGLHGVMAEVEPLVSSGLLTDMLGLSLAGEMLSESQLSQLLAAPARLQKLDIRGNFLSLPQLAAILASSGAPRLKHLDLSATWLDDAAIGTLLAGGGLNMAELDFLGLRNNRFTPSGVQRLKNSVQLQQVSRVDLKGNPRTRTQPELRYFFDPTDTFYA